MPGVERVLVPVGGGGLITGVAAALHGVRPEIEVVGVITGGYPMWEEALRRGGPVSMTPHTIADGVAAPCNQVMLDRLRDAVDRWLVVPEERLQAAIRSSRSAARWPPKAPGRWPTRRWIRSTTSGRRWRWSPAATSIRRC